MNSSTHPAIDLPASQSATPPACLVASQLGFGFEPGRPLFKDLSVHIPSGVTLIRGGDGRGKTTLMRVLAGALAAADGELGIRGISLKEEPARYRQQVFWTEPRTEAFDQLTPPEYFETVRSRYAGFNAAVLAQLIEELGLAPHMAKQLFMLSTGSRRKVWIAAAFASQATVTFIDEPFAALDAPSIRCVLQRLQTSAALQERAFVIADYEAPADLLLTKIIDLGD